MFKIFLGQYRRAFIEILFIRLNSDTIRQFHFLTKTTLYLSAFTLFYLPIFYFSINQCRGNHGLILYFLCMLAVHILAKVMLCNSKRIRKRFSTIKTRKHFFIRSWLILEYVVFMWLVYLFYPLTCILIPFSLWGMSMEGLLGYNYLFDLYLRNSEQYILLGGVVSYILFIVADGYERLKAGFLPDYLGLYAVLTVVSGSIGKTAQSLLNWFPIDTDSVTSSLSRIFALGNNSMNIVASAITFLFALHSLYTSYNESDTQQNTDEEPDPNKPKADDA